MVSAWIPGRIDKLFVDFTGTQVVKGESMVWIYSPDLVSTQEEYLLALETLEKVSESTFDEVKMAQNRSLRHRKDGYCGGVSRKNRLTG